MNLEEYLAQLKQLSETSKPETQTVKQTAKDTQSKRTRLKKKQFTNKKN